MTHSLAIVLVLASVVFGGVPSARAHYAGTALLHLAEQREPGRFLVRFVPSTNMKRSDAPVVFAYPAQCIEDGAWLNCGRDGLYGFVTAHNLPRHAEVIVEIERADRSRLTRVMGNGRVSVEIPESPNAAGTASAFVQLGIRHILEGFDHLAFVLGLVLLVGFNRRLVATVTAFTVAHSVTLSLDVLGALSLPRGPIEAAVALSLVLLALEVVRERDSLSRRYPWSIALGFGLIHGLGFAGALREVGLPEAHRALSLLFFNLGVEAGQLAVIAALCLAAWLSRHVGAIAERLAPTRRALGYVVGGLGAFWFIDRTLGLFGLGGA